jgi:hypothetical protein
MSPVQAQVAVSKNPKLASLIKSMISGASKVPKFLTQAKSAMAKTFPKGASFISQALDWFSSIMKRFVSSLESLLGKKSPAALKAGASTSGVLYGFEKGVDTYATYKTGLNKTQRKNLETLSNIRQYYGGKDPFD